MHPFPREHWHNVYLIGPLKQLDRGAARRQSRSPPVSGLMEIEDHQHVHRPRFTHESMRTLTQPQRERASPERPLRLAHWRQCASRSGYPMGLSRALSAFYTN
jgi:hypothetical protein